MIEYLIIDYLTSRYNRMISISPELMTIGLSIISNAEIWLLEKLSNPSHSLYKQMPLNRKHDLNFKVILWNINKWLAIDNTNKA